MDEKTDAVPWPWSLKDAPAAITASALVAGVVVYGLLATAYDEFYAELGLTPADVGISYGQALGGAAALSVLVVLLMAGFTYGIWRTTRHLGGWTRRRAWFAVAMAAAAAVVVAQLAGTIAGFVLLAASAPLLLGRQPVAMHDAGRAAVAAVSGAGDGHVRERDRPRPQARGRHQRRPRPVPRPGQRIAGRVRRGHAGVVSPAGDQVPRSGAELRGQSQ